MRHAVCLSRLALLALAWAAGSLACGAAWAQTLPPSVDPSRIPAPTALPPARASGVTLPRLEIPAEDAAGAGDGAVRVTLRGVRVEGATAFPPGTFEDAGAALIGHEVGLGEIRALAQSITQRYREQGYLLARVIVPPQDVTEGQLRLQVFEGVIESYKIESDSPAVRAALTPLAEKLVAVKPLTSTALERYLLLMNDLPGLTVKSVLSPAPDAAGAAAITLIVTRKRTGAALGLDTYGNAYLGPERVNGNLLVNGVIDARDSVALSALAAPDHSELAYGALAYSRVVGAEGTVIGLSASRAHTDPSLPPALGGLLRPNGDATDISLTAQHPLVRSRSLTLSLDGVAESSRNTTVYAPGLGDIETQDDQRIVGGGVTMSLADGWQGFSQLQLGFRKGLDLAGASRKGDANLSRALGDPQFFKLSGEATRYQALFGPFSLLGGLQGQWTNDSLLASEQYGVGGPRYGRGFDSSEITGDRGFAAKAELIWQPDLGGWFGPFAVRGTPVFSDLQFYGFYDGGMVWNVERTTGQPGRDSLTSAGFGSRATLLDRVAGDIFFAVPLTNRIASRALDKQDDWRMEFSLRATLW